jgi:hypothetical protein
MTGENFPRMVNDYVADFDREFAQGSNGSPTFFAKWKLLIELVTGVHMLEIRGLQAYAVANVAAMKCRRFTSES